MRRLGRVLAASLILGVMAVWAPAAHGAGFPVAAGSDTTGSTPGRKVATLIRE